MKIISVTKRLIFFKTRELYYKYIIKKKIYKENIVNNCEFIVSSIGRSGSTLISSLISDSTQRPVYFFKKLSDYSEKFDKDLYIIKTHEPLDKKIIFNYKAIFIYGDIGDAIASIYNMPNFRKHLINLGVTKINRLIFNCKYLFNKDRAFIFLVKGDKLNFRKNINSWKNDKNTLLINFEKLLKNKEKTLKQISEFLNLEIPNFGVRKRKSSHNKLSKILVNEINKEYGNLNIAYEK